MMSCRIFSFFFICVLIFRVGSGLVVGAPSKLTLTTDGLKPSKLLLIISHPPPPAVISAHVLSHEHVVLTAAHAAAAVSTTSLQTVHNSDPVVPSVTHTVTHISHHASPHPASTVNGHSLGYGATPIALYKSYETPTHTHESVYTVHVGGFGVGLHVGGHGHGHGYFAVL